MLSEETHLSKWMNTIKEFRYPAVITLVLLGSVAVFQNVTTIQTNAWTQIVDFKKIEEPYYFGNNSGYSNSSSPSAQVGKFTTNADVCDYRIRTYGKSSGRPFTYIAHASSAYASNGGGLQLNFNYEDIKPILSFKCLNGSPASVNGLPTVVQLRFFNGSSLVPSKMLMNSSILTNGTVCGMNLSPSAVQLIPLAKESTPATLGGTYGQNNPGDNSVYYARLEHRCYSTSPSGPVTGTSSL